MLETIKEYLVSLGFSVDKNSYNQTTKAMNELGGGLSQLASNAVKMFGQAAAAVASFGVAITAGTAKFLNGLGNQEIQMEILSRQLWTTQQQAQAFNATLKAMGTNLQSLYLSPTLMAQYNQLHSVALQMATPSDYNNQIKMIQNVSLQLKQMQLEAYYALQWIGYYFIKYMQGPISNVQNVLQSINDVIVKNMPTWTKQVAQVMASFMQAGIYIVQALAKVWSWLDKLLQYVPGWAKGIAAALAIFSISNPFMLFMEAIGGAILLLDDFETYLHGGQSALAPFWAWVMKVVDAMKQMGIGTQIAQGLKVAFDRLDDTFQIVGKDAENMFKVFQKNGTIKNYIDAYKSYGQAVMDLADAIGNVITGIGHLFGLFNNSTGQSNMTNFFQLLFDLGNTAVETVAGAVEELAGLVNIVGDALHGDWKGAAQVIQNMWTGQNLANTGIIPQSSVAGAMGPAVGPSSYPYMFQGSTTTSTKNVTVNAPLTNHISGSSAQATATAINNSYNMHMHTLQNAIG